MKVFWRTATAPTGRWLKWLVIAGWLAISVVATPLAAGLTDAQTNNASAFLPDGAESTRLLDEQRTLPGGDGVPAVAVFARDGGLTDADRAAVEKIRVELEPFAATGIPPAISSPDGRAALLTILMPQLTDAEEFTAKVERMREIVHANTPAGVEEAITGPAGLVTDSFDIFKDIDVKILMVTASVVALILLVVYRSPILWLVPLISVALADQAATAIIYLLAEHVGLVVNGQSAGILRVLVFGAGTDYALLLIARYREELTRHSDAGEAMRVALHRAGPAILAAAVTVIISLSCLLLGELNSDRGLGPVGAIGIACAFVTMTTLLPAAMVACGRRLFWPFVPRFGAAVSDTSVLEESGIWSRVGGAIERRQRLVWVVVTLILAGFATCAVTLDQGLRPDQAFRSPTESVLGQQLVAASYPPGATAPTYVMSNVAQATAVLDAVRGTPGVVTAFENARNGDLVQIVAILDAPPDTEVAYDVTRALRDAAHGIDGADALVGGNNAVNLDVREAAVRDQQMIIPIVLAVVVVILGLLLRAIVTPLVLIATVVLSFFAALGVSARTFDWGFGFAGSDPTLPLFGFIFLVALGIDYNIFLMTRVREESARLGHRAGVLHGLAVTGSVITSAGFVLAGTFSVLVILPLVQLAEVGFLVAFGVLLDTFVVRSVLVPALALDIGPNIWWPSQLARLSRNTLPPSSTDPPDADDTAVGDAGEPTPTTWA